MWDIRTIRSRYGDAPQRDGIEYLAGQLLRRSSLLSSSLVWRQLFNTRPIAPSRLPRFDVPEKRDTDGIRCSCLAVRFVLKVSHPGHRPRQHDFTSVPLFTDERHVRSATFTDHVACSHPSCPRRSSRGCAGDPKIAPGSEA